MFFCINKVLCVLFVKKFDLFLMSNNMFSVIICVVVLYLLRLFILTAACVSSFFVAYYFRSAFMVILCLMMMIDGIVIVYVVMFCGVCVYSRYRDVVIMSLLVIGFKNVSNALFVFNRFVRYLFN